MDLNDQTLELVGRSSALFDTDINRFEYEISTAVRRARFLVIGGAGSIGQAVTREIFKRDPLALHVVDISENNLVELVRDIRSTIGYNAADFRTFAIDCDSREFDFLFSHEGPYDFVLNLSALKHVRSEKDPYTLMRLVQVNIFNSLKILNFARDAGAEKYFCVSTDKAANPVNVMGASKRIMEMYLTRESESQRLSMARFANVAFSDGSLLHGFNQRFAKRQPLSAPYDINRYFLSPQESGELCLISCLLGGNRDILFPKVDGRLPTSTFADIATRFLKRHGFEPYECDSEVEARSRVDELIGRKLWPVYFFKSDTTGEKDIEEFYTEHETIDMQRFESIGVIKNPVTFDREALDVFSDGISSLYRGGEWTKNDIIHLMQKALPTFAHRETGKHLDQRM